MSNTDGEDTQKVSLGELLLNAGTRIVDLEKQSNDQVEIITHLEKELASLREQHLFERASRKGFIKRLEQQLQQKEDENRELVEYLEFFIEYSEKSQYQLSLIKYDDVMYKRIEAKKLISRLSAKLGKV